MQTLKMKIVIFNSIKVKFEILQRIQSETPPLLPKVTINQSKIMHVAIIWEV